MKYGEGFLLVYSIESRQSFNELEIFYQQILRMKDSASFPMIIVGTKCDLEYQRQVPSSGPSAHSMAPRVPSEN
jgi:GTPase KRas protein